MLLMIWHLDRESAIIVLSTSNIYMHEIKKKVNKKVIAFLYVALFIFNKKVIFYLEKTYFIYFYVNFILCGQHNHGRFMMDQSDHQQHDKSGLC